MLMDIDKIKNQADICLQQEDLTTAVSIYEKCLDLAPDVISLYWYSGLCWLLLGDEEKCQMIWLSSFTNPDFQEDETAFTEFIDFLKNQGQAYLSNHKNQISQKIYEAILEWDNSEAEVYYYLGHAIANQGDLETATSYWQMALEIEPDYQEAHLYQAYVWQKLQQFDPAIESYQSAISLQEDFLTYYQLGLCYSQIGEWELAKCCWQNTIRIKNDYAPAYSDLGLVFLHQGDFLAAVNNFQQAIKIEPDFCQALIDFSENSTTDFKNSIANGIQLIQSLNSYHVPINEISLLLHKIIGNFYPEISLRLLKNICEHEPDNSLASLELSSLLLTQNQSSEALAILENLLDVYDNEQVYLHLGKCSFNLQDYQQAIFYFSQAIKLNSNLIEAYYLLGMTLFQTGNLAASINVLKQQLEREFNSPVTLAYLGFILANNHEFNEAIFYFKKSIEINSYITTLVDELLANLTHIQEFDVSQIELVSPPRNFYESTQAWLNHNHSFTPDNYLEIYPEIDVKLTYPQSLNHDIHFSFRFGNLVKLPASYIIKIPQGRFWLNSDQTESAIIINESHFLADISPYFPILSPNHPDKHPSQHPILSMQKLPPVHFISGKVAVLAGLTNHVYFHWMLDVLPRWELLRIGNYDFSEIDYFVVDNRLPFQQETLTKLQIPTNKQINIHQIQHLQATELIVPSFPGCVAWMPNWTCNFLKQQFLNSENIKLPFFPSSPKRIYITRKLAKSRRVVNEDKIFNLLQAYNFETVILESMSVTEQALLFSQAEIIISPHGSGLTNLVFCQPGTKVIELFSPNYVYHCYWWISNLVGLDYYYLIGENLPGWYLHHLIYPQEFAEDIFMKIQDVEKILQITNTKI